MPVPMLDLQAQYQEIKDEVDQRVAEVFTSQLFRGGPIVTEFEQAIADYCNVKHAIGVSSGTDALLLSLKALGIKPGDEVIAPTFTFFATAGAIVNAGAHPVFVDISPDTFLINTTAVEQAITPRTRAIIPVHLYGQCADMTALRAIAEQHDIALLEDNAQALGASQNGVPAGSMGTAGALSFYPTKNLGGAGEGGMITTNDDALADQVKLQRCHGMESLYHHEIVGTNSHLHALQAAVLGVKLPHLNDWSAKRAQHAAYYDKHFSSIEGVTSPLIASNNKHVYQQYIIRLPTRDQAVKLLRSRDIGCGVFYPVPLHQQECFAEYGAGKAQCPNAETACQEVLALPIHPNLTTNQLDEVIAAITDHIG